MPCADLDRIQLEHKIRLLTFASLGFKHVGHDLPYSTVAEALHVDTAEVEKWAIDGKNGLLHSQVMFTHAGYPL